MEFEHLANRVVGLAMPFLLSCFVLGLTPELCCEVQALQLMCLPQAVALAKLQEDKLLDRHHSHRPSHNYTPQPSPPNPAPAPSSPKLPFR